MTRPSAVAGPRPRRESGVAAIMVAIMVTVLCVAGAFVLDFGLVRFDKRSNQSAADMASAAGIRATAGPDGMLKPFRGVCEAVKFLRANHREIDADLSWVWKDGNGSLLTGNPCSNSSTYRDHNCLGSDRATWAWFDGQAAGGRIEVDIKSGYDLSDPLFASEESTLAGESGDSALAGCDQLAVIISEKETPGLGRLAMPEGSLSSRVRSVARVVKGDQAEAAVAMLLLERSDCQVLTIGGSLPSIVVRGAGTRPALIHVDSLGNGANCSSTNKIIDANFGPPARIVAEDAELGSPPAPGIIGIVALTNAAGARPEYASDPSPNQVYAEGQPGGAPVGRALVTRQPIDRRYRLPVQAEITKASIEWNRTAADAAAAGYTVVGCSATSSTAPRVFVNCPGGVTYTGTGATFIGDTVVFNGPVTVEGASSALRIPNAKKVYIKGSTTTSALTVKAGLQVNDGALPDCASRFATNRSLGAAMVLGSGGIKAEGNAAVRLCQTAVILAGNTSGTCPIPSVDGVAPYDNTCRGLVQTAGSANVEWTSPNAVGPDPTQTHFDQFEDLALWTEASGDPNYPAMQHSLMGGGVFRLSGVFFLPNANPFTVGGGGASEITSNAQFVARKLTVAGNGRFVMQPSPNDVVTFPYFGDAYLVR